MSAPASDAPEIAAHFVQVSDSASDDDGGGSRVEIPVCMGVRRHMMNYLHVDRVAKESALDKTS